MSYLPFIKETIEHAGEIARSYFGNVSSETKPEDNNQVLTEADIAIGEYIVERIQSVYPEHNIIDEEAGVINNGSNVTRVVDPIDGTSNFAAATPLYGCMIGVLQDDQPVAGGVVLPSLNEVYLAESGAEATRNGVKISVSGRDKLSDMLISYGIDGYADNPERTRQEARLIGEIALKIRNLRTSNSVFDLMTTANGSYGAFLNQTSKIWDNVAPQIIIQEAGGIYTDFYGNPIDYSNAIARVDQNFTVCAASPAAHAGLQTLIRAHNN